MHRHLASTLLASIALSACGSEVADRSSVVPPVANQASAQAPVAGATASGAGVVLAEGDNSFNFNFDVQDVAPPGEVVADGYVAGAALRFRGKVTAVTSCDPRSLPAA